MAQPIEWADYDAVLFDLDGVITPTADVHERAWAELFHDYDFTTDDYLSSIDGRPRYDGVRTFLASRGVTLPEGTPDDPPGDDTVCALGNRKNELFNDLLESRGYSIIQTRNGMEAIGLARAHHPDLILMDIQLPEVSGLVVTKWLKEDDELQSIPVIAVTAFAMKGDEERILQGGCEGYISKPISVPHFLETIARYIGPAN